MKCLLRKVERMVSSSGEEVGWKVGTALGRMGVVERKRVVLGVEGGGAARWRRRAQRVQILDMMGRM